MSEPLMTEAQRDAIGALLEDARGRYPASALERFEEALMIAVGVKPRPPLPHLQDPSFYFPGLTAKPWHDPAGREVTSLLEGAWTDVRDELLTVLEQRKGFQPFREDGNQERDDWNIVYLKGDSRRVAENRAMFPRTSRLVDAIPRAGAGAMAMLSAVQPGGHIAAHNGPMNLRLTVHLGLVIPPACRFRVGAETRTWQEGRCLLFDESFEHEVWNESDRTRFVLLADMWHPDLTDVEISLLEQCDAILKKSQGLASIIDAGTAELDGKRWWA